MGIRDDLNDLKKSWSSFSPLTKVFFGATFLTSSLSLASIADSVFQLRGFISTAIDFYRSLVEPLRALVAEYLRLEFVQVQVDEVIFLTLIVGSYLRAGRVVRMPSQRRDNILMVLVAALVMALVIFHNHDPDVYLLLNFGFVIAFTWPLIYPKGLIVFNKAVLIALKKASFGKLDLLEERDALLDVRNDQIVAINMLAIFLFVAVVAGISEGLTRV